MGEALFEGLVQGVWALILCGPILVASVAATVFVVRRRALAGGDSGSERSDQLFWDLFLGSAVAVPALLIPTLISPWTGLFLGGAGVAAGVAAYRGTPKYLARRAARSDYQALESAHVAARAQHDELIARWRRYELDPACSIDYPSLTDVRLPETSALIKAMRAADQLRNDPHQGYPEAVARLAASLAAAERAAGIPAEQS
ncbi:hypothetical protein [Pseudarthrobacter sp. NS4]|uniref:hypothetical protein n=1 Tax=Pseudarthrobacter sp. NS4 TaxID=2973976 RepID=UPI00216280F1|nr:hypothetical protein [Pseudarthrobacter sp. NS4]